jgi:uncharacterized protein (TIGR01244 family)
MKRIIPLAVLFSLVAGCDSKAPEAPPKPGDAVAHKAITTDKLEPYSCGSIQRLHTFGGIFLASQPSAADFEQAKDGGVKTVINMRSEGEFKDFDEKALVEKLGLKYVNPAVKNAADLTDAKFDEYVALLKTAERPILLHCASSNRVGAVWAAYRATEGGLSFDEALKEAKTVGLKGADLEARAKAYVEARKKP